jgi:Lrp/AsnC family transcriptional regulator, leucine-responsive regulatory protein
MKSDFNLDDVDWAILSQLQTDADIHNQVLGQRVGVSPATALRRVARLKAQGFIERTVAVLSPDRVAAARGAGLAAVVEVSLDDQSAQALDAFEARAVASAPVQQVWRVSPGPDFCLVVHVADMPAYHAWAQGLLTAELQVRTVRSFFAIKRAKFQSKLPLTP